MQLLLSGHEHYEKLQETKQDDGKAEAEVEQTGKNRALYHHVSPAFADDAGSANIEACTVGLVLVDNTRGGKLEEARYAAGQRSALRICECRESDKSGTDIVYCSLLLH